MRLLPGCLRPLKGAEDLHLSFLRWSRDPVSGFVMAAVGGAAGLLGGLPWWGVAPLAALAVARRRVFVGIVLQTATGALVAGAWLFGVAMGMIAATFLSLVLEAAGAEDLGQALEPRIALLGAREALVLCASCAIVLWKRSRWPTLGALCRFAFFTGLAAMILDTVAGLPPEVVR